MTMPLPEGTQVIPGGAPTSTSVPQNLNTSLIPPPEGQYFTAEQVEAIRQQEKDKLYGKQRSLEEQLTVFKGELDQYRTEREQAEAAKAEAEQRAAEAARKAEEEKLSVTELLQRRDSEWAQKQQELETRFELERAHMEKDRALFNLQNYTQRRVAEEIAANAIIPDLVQFVNGNTEQEVEESITKVKAITDNIVEGSQRMNSGQPTQPGVSPTGFSPTGPFDAISGTQEVSPDDVRAMSMQEYAAYRAKRGIDRAGNDRGLFS